MKDRRTKELLKVRVEEVTERVTGNV
jgi:hypothetical protein